MPEDPGDYASTLLIEAEDESELPEEGEVLGSYEDMYFVGFGTETKAEDLDGASENMAFSIASGPNTVGEAAYEGNAFDHLEDALEHAPKGKARGKAYTVALIDTGAPKSMEGVSMLGDDGADLNGHATKMLETMRLSCPDVEVLPIKALDDNGRGDASTVYSAIQYAIAQNVDAINLSFYGRASEGNLAVERAIQDAANAGIAVVGASGNDGKDAKGYLPGGLDDVLVIGAAGADRKPLPISNYGETVDAYLEEGSTSEAAAKFSGYLALYDGDISRAMEHAAGVDVPGLPKEPPKGTEPPVDGFVPAMPESVGDRQAASKPYSVSAIDEGIEGIVNYEYFDFLLYEDALTPDTVQIVDAANGSHWKLEYHDYYSSGTIQNHMILYCDKPFSASPVGTTLDGADATVSILLPDAVLGSGGIKYDLKLTFSNIKFKREDNMHGMLLCLPRTGKLPTFQSSALVEDTWEDENGKLRHTMMATSVDVTYQVMNKDGSAACSSNEKKGLVLSYNDLDQPFRGEGHNTENAFLGGNYYSESITVKSGMMKGRNADVYVKSGCVLLDNEKVNGSTVKLDQGQFYAGEVTNGNEYDSAVTFIGNAAGTTVTWTGSICGTGSGIAIDYFCTVTVQVRHQKKDGNWTSYTRLDRRTLWLDDKYYYAYTEPAANNAIYGDTGTDQFKETVGSDGFSEDVTYSIDVPRVEYTYCFNGNKPSGASGTVSGVHGDITKLAENKPGAVGNPALTGYTFKGWYDTSASTGGNKYNKDETMLSDKTFYARWEANKYYVAYDPNGATNFDHEAGEFTQNVTTGTMEKSTYYTGTAGTLRKNAFGREGYDFVGWNTKADGTGTSYPDEYGNVLNWTDEAEKTITLYAQWKKKLGKETLTVVSEETGNRVPGVTLKLYKKVERAWTDTGTQLTTNAQGQVSVTDLRWYNYEWRMTDVPAGYVKSADTGFTIKWDNLSATNTVILYMKHVQVILDSRVDEIIKGENPPAFFYHMEGRDAAGVNHAYDVMVQVDKTTLNGTNKIPDLFAGTYKVTQTPVSRYNPQNAQNVSHTTPDGINATVDVLNYNSAEALFPYTIKQMGGFGSMDSKVNRITK